MRALDLSTRPERRRDRCGSRYLRATAAWAAALLLALGVSPAAHAAKKLKFELLRRPGLVTPGIRSVAVLRPHDGGRIPHEPGALDRFPYTYVREVVPGAVYSERRVPQRSQADPTLPASHAAIAEIGHDLGVDAVMITWIESNERTASYVDDWRDEDGVRRKIDCRRRTVETLVSVRVVRSEDGTAAGQRLFEKTLSREKCVQVGDLASAQEIAFDTLAAIGEQLRREAAPEYVPIALPWGKPAREARARSSRAFALASDGRVDEARAILVELLQANPDDAVLHYQRGVLAEAAANLAAAGKAYARAHELQPQALYETAIARVGQRRRQLDALALMGIRPEQSTAVGAPR